LAPYESSMGNNMDTPITEHMPRDCHDEEKILRQLASNERMAELGRLAAGIIHEINTPLSVIGAASQMILYERDLPESVVEMVERIHLEVQRLSQLTRGILSFSRDEGPEGETDVNLVLHEVLSFLKYEILKRSITVIEDLDPQLPLLDASPNLLKQILLNLIVNSLQAMEHDGRIYLATSPEGDGMIRITIRDTGPGIPSNAIEKIFDPFFSTKESGEGTGLGLFISRNNIEKLGGRIMVESKEGLGACFVVLLPSEEYARNEP
jgi:signal transduction histidine kinase